MKKICDKCNCDEHDKCHIIRIEMGWQGLLMTGGKDSGFIEHRPHEWDVRLNAKNS